MFGWVDWWDGGLGAWLFFNSQCMGFDLYGGECLCDVWKESLGVEGRGSIFGTARDILKIDAYISMHSNEFH